MSSIESEMENPPAVQIPEGGGIHPDSTNEMVEISKTDLADLRAVVSRSAERETELAVLKRGELIRETDIDPNHPSTQLFFDHVVKDDMSTETIRELADKHGILVGDPATAADPHDGNPHLHMGAEGEEGQPSISRGTAAGSNGDVAAVQSMRDHAREHHDVLVKDGATSEDARVDVLSALIEEATVTQAQGRVAAIQRDTEVVARQVVDKR